jgi:hypothetical protein
MDIEEQNNMQDDHEFARRDATSAVSARVN